MSVSSMADQTGIPPMISNVTGDITTVGAQDGKGSEGEQGQNDIVYHINETYNAERNKDEDIEIVYDTNNTSGTLRDDNVTPQNMQQMTKK